MTVDFKKAAYRASIRLWERARDCYGGSDKVKAAGTKYLPPLDSHLRQTGAFNPSMAIFNAKYQAYVERSLFYNATARTVDGLAGFVFQKDPTIEVSTDAMEEQLVDITMTGVDAMTFALRTFQEMLLIGRYGVLVDVLAGQDGKMVPPEDQRPYWAGYLAEDIISWSVKRIGGDPQVLTRVVLREEYEEESEKDEFEFETGIEYLVLELNDAETNPVYTQTRWRKPKNTEGSVAGMGEKWEKVSDVTPERHGQPLDRIPFQFIGVSSLTPDVQKGPLVDLVDMNISHYRTMADLEHGRHFTALPTPWTSGARGQDSNEPLSIGSGVAWDLEKGGSAGMLEFSGAGLGALVTAEQDKRKMMAILGARLLEEQPSAGAETATAIMMRHASEGATLRSLVATVSEALTRVLRLHEWWLPGQPAAIPGDLDCTFQLNREFFAVKMNPQELQTQLQLLQAEAISYETFYHNITVGGWTRAGVTSEDEKKQISIEAPMEPPQPAGGPPALGDQPGAGGPGVGTGDVVAYDEGPYKIIKRDEKFLVIKADTGTQVGKTKHGTLEEAKRYLAALQMHSKEKKK